MVHNCANCLQLISENFCSNCGQKKFKRIDRKYVLDEVQYMVLHTNKGFLYSLKNVIKNPGKTAKEFIEGNRVNHYKPLLLTFVLSGVSSFISHKIVGMSDIMREYYSSQHLNSPLMNDMLTVASSYNSALMLLLVPLFAIVTKLAFRKWGNNYYEHIIMNCYIISFYTVINILLVYPILYLFRDNSSVFMQISSASLIILPFILIWFYKGFYAEKSLKSVVGKVLRIVGLLLLGYLALIIIGAIVVFVMITIMGPDALQYVKPK